MRGRGGLAQHQQDVLAVEREGHDRQRDHKRCPKSDAKRAPHAARIASAEGLRGQRRDRGDQSHSEGETDEQHRVRQRGGGDRLIPEASDQGKIGRHHRNLAKLR